MGAVPDCCNNEQKEKVFKLVGAQWSADVPDPAVVEDVSGNQKETQALTDHVQEVERCNRSAQGLGNQLHALGTELGEKVSWPRMTSKEVCAVDNRAPQSSIFDTNGSEACLSVFDTNTSEAVARFVETRPSNLGVLGLSEGEDELGMAKSTLKAFAKRMVRGRRIDVMTQSGELKTCRVSISRSLDTLKVKSGGFSRSIAMWDVEEVHVGKHVDGIATPLDELCVTVALASGNCISFRCDDVLDRDTFIGGLTILSLGHACEDAM